MRWPKGYYVDFNGKHLRGPFQYLETAQLCIQMLEEQYLIIGFQGLFGHSKLEIKEEK